MSKCCLHLCSEGGIVAKLASMHPTVSKGFGSCLRKRRNHPAKTAAATIGVSECAHVILEGQQDTLLRMLGN